MWLVPSIAVVSMEEINKLVFKFMFLELLPLGIRKIYVCRIENNDVKQKSLHISCPYSLLGCPWTTL